MSTPVERTPLTPAEFEQFQHGAETYREDLVVSLAGSVGLRPSEMARLRLGDLEQYRHDGSTWYLLTVREDDDGQTRTTYVPRRVAHDIQKFANAGNSDAHDPGNPENHVFGVSARRLQMLVSSVGDRATSERLSAVSPHDLRQYFAHTLLTEHGVHPRLVQSMGGWRSLDSLASFFDAPTDSDILAACAPAVDGIGTQTESRMGTPTDDDPFTRRSDDLLLCQAMLGERLADATTQAGVASAVCASLAASFDGVWFCDEDGTVHERAGTGSVTETILADVLAETDLKQTAASATNVIECVETGEVGEDDKPVESNVKTDETDGSSHAGVDLCLVAVQSRDAGHGFLCVADRADHAFDTLTRRMLADVGRRVGSALMALKRKRLLMADTGVELTLRSSASESPLVAVSTRLGCRLELDGVVPMARESLLHFVRVEDARPGDVLDAASDTAGVVDTRLIRDYGTTALFEFVVEGPSLASTMVETGGSVRRVTVGDGTARITGVFAGDTDVRTVIERFGASFSDAELLSKRDVEEPMQTTARVDHVVYEELTERQRAVLRAAFLSGYFEWPRGSTAEELAASMDVSSPTLHNHLRKAQQKLLTAVFVDDNEQGAKNSK